MPAMNILHRSVARPAGHQTRCLCSLERSSQSLINPVSSRLLCQVFTKIEGAAFGLDLSPNRLP
jgi:hypothetical protein